MKCSVITVTSKYGGIDITWSSLKRQTYSDFEWILCDTLYEHRWQEVQEFTRHDKRVKHFKQSEKDKKAVTWLAHAENQAIREAKGELIILLQDYIWIPPTGIERFVSLYEKDRILTGVGDQYGKPCEIVNEKGLITVFEKEFTGKPEVVVWEDPRKDGRESFTECAPIEIEFNWAAVPRKAFYDVGGVDEEYDYIGFAYDNTSVCERAKMVGYKMYMDQHNECRGIYTDAFWPNKIKESNPEKIAKFHLRKMQKITRRELSPKYNYLDEGQEK